MRRQVEWPKRAGKQKRRRRGGRPKYTAPGSSRRENQRFVAEIVELMKSRTTETTHQPSNTKR